jgi:hypothetical protein
MYIPSPAWSWAVFLEKIFFLLYTLSMCLSFFVSEINFLCTPMSGTCFLIQSASLYLLTKEFGLLEFTVIIECYVVIPEFCNFCGA